MQHKMARNEIIWEAQRGTRCRDTAAHKQAAHTQEVACQTDSRILVNAPTEESSGTVEKEKTQTKPNL